MVRSLTLQVISVVRNDENGIKRTLESLITHAEAFTLNGINLELIIQDGCSTDQTVLVATGFLKSFDDVGVKVSILSENDNSLFHAMNKATNRANKECLAIFLNAGDTLHQQLDVAMVSHALIEFNSSHDDLLFLVSENYSENGYYRMPGKNCKNVMDFLSWMKFNTPVHQAVIFRLNGDIPIHYRLDWDIMADSYLIYYISKFSSIRFEPLLFCKFELGGLSGNYKRFDKVHQQVKEQLAISKLRAEPAVHTYVRLFSLYVKFILTNILGVSLFSKFHIFMLKNFKGQ